MPLTKPIFKTRAGQKIEVLIKNLLINYKKSTAGVNAFKINRGKRMKVVFGTTSLMIKFITRITRAHVFY